MVEIGAASTAEAEALLAAGVEVATVAVVEMEVVNVAVEFEAGPMERHSCCMEWAHGLQDKLEKHTDNLVYWRKHVFEAWFWRLVGCEGRLMLTR